MNYQVIEQTIKAGYREATPIYRRDDEIEVTTPNHQRVSSILRRICASFPHPIRAMDVGCGTGRYFHCLQNVSELLGVDISDDMLRAAENPVKSDEISIPEIRLVCANVYLTHLPPETFHFIYSLGMFGNGCPVTVDICNSFHDWLVPGGKLYFNTIDTSGQPLNYRIRRGARDIVYPWLPQRLQRALDEREARHPFFGLTKRELRDVLVKSKFTEFEIESHRCQSPLWDGRHLECVATKT